MKRVYRYDRGTVEVLERGKGFIRARVAIARAGVFPYLSPDGGIRMEAKLPEEIFSDVTIETAKGAPVCDGHPPLSDSGGLITPANYKNYVKGALGDSFDIKKGPGGEELLIGSETIYDQALIADLEADNKVEVSIGFETEIDTTPGEFNGQRYDAAQRNIRINHVAHVEEGRAGDTVRAYLDEDIPDGVHIAVMQEKNKETEMKVKDTRHDAKKVREGIRNFFSLFARRKDEDDITAAPDLADEIAAAIAATEPPASADEAAALASEVEELKAKLAELQSTLEEKSAQLEAMQALQSPAAQDAAIKSRLDLVELGRSVVTDFKADGLSNRDIKLRIIEKLLPFPAEVKADALKDEVIDARYDAAAALARERANVRSDSVHRVTIDEAEIEKKRQGRLTLHDAKRA